MRRVRHGEIAILGYPIDRIEHVDDSGRTQSRYYEIRCPRSGIVIGTQPSLRAAKRWVVVQELRAFTKARKHARQRRAVRAT